MVVKGFRRTGAGMVDITRKKNVFRMSRAEGVIHLKQTTINAIVKKKVPKGDVLEIAKAAAINAVKKTSELIFFCHPISITNVNVSFKLSRSRISAIIDVRSVGKTGVEMEALVGVASALLTIWDMVKGFEKDEAGQYPTTAITDVKVIRKSKG